MLIAKVSFDLTDFFRLNELIELKINLDWLILTD
jgi:hypothetical protein